MNGIKKNLDLDISFSTMRNSNLVFCLLLSLLVRSSLQTADSDESSDGYTSDSEAVQWQLLTKINYSDEIRRHPHVLLLVTVPWSGESRSLMKQLARVVANDKASFGTLKLMLLYKNSERMLANTLGATDEITIIYFHHALAYKYGGKLRVQTILSSMRYVMPLSPEEFPITSLNTPEDLKVFLDSTDKAVLLLEFCGWAPRLLTEERNNMTGHAFGDIAKFNGSLLLEEMRKQKAMKYNQMTCSIGTGVNGLPWLTDFSLGNITVLTEDETLTPESSSVCKIDDLQRLEYFLPKFINFAREFFLPPERIRFGLVSERSFLRELNIEASASWLMTLHVAGCPSCSKVLKENDDLKLVLQTQGSEVTELENDVHDLLPVLPANKPSVLLFVDRSSDSLNVREQSKIALDAFRELALRRQLLNWTNELNKGQIGVHSHETDQASKTSKHPKLALSPSNQNAYIKEKTSLVIMNDGKQISLDNLLPDLQGSSLQEILEHLLHQKKEIKLSKVAKDAGFQLLSEDFVIKSAEDLSSQQESQSGQVLELPSDDVSETTLDLDDDQKLQRASASGPQNNEGSSSSDAESFQKDDEKYVNSTEQQNENYPAYTSEQLSHSHTHDTLGYAPDNKFEEDMLTGPDQKKHRNDFSGSFFFCDGNMRLLKALTATSKIPSMVIIAPLTQQHFILPEPTVFSHSLLSDYLDEFVNGSLTPYEQSEISVESPREAPTPPFVNLDFHEVDSIPKVAVHTFTEQVLGNQSNLGNATDAWSRDVLVLFSNNWCGFCQRMELVVREVYRAILGYSTMFENGSMSTSLYNMKNSSFPLVYLMDCTLNDCRRILTSAVEREVYPHLVLFPAGKKNPIPYEGDFSVSQIINFLADCGALAWDEGIPLAGVHQGGNFSKSAPVSQITYHEVLLKERSTAQHNLMRVDSLANSYEINPNVVVGSFLSATDKLLDAHPFSESKILIVKADQDTGFEGLIVNKHLNWNTIEHLEEEGLQLLKVAPLSYGGPVMKRGMPLVALCHHPRADHDPEILPGIYYLDQLQTVRLIEEVRLKSKSVDGYWFFLGFSNWGWNQLFQEIAQGAWEVWEGNAEQLDWAEAKR